MTFNANVPNASQSPSLFPPQNITNMTRLKTIIDADHFFQDSTTANEGSHKQVTLTVRDMPAVPPPAGTNGIFYSWLDADSQAQLRWYNGTTDIQLTPYQTLLPIRVVGSASFTTGQTQTIFADPGYRWAGTGWIMVDNTRNYTFYNILRAGSNIGHLLDQNTDGISPPTMSFSTNDLTATNNSSQTRTLVWSLIINRIS